MEIRDKAPDSSDHIAIYCSKSIKKLMFPASSDGSNGADWGLNPEAKKAKIILLIVMVSLALLAISLTILELYQKKVHPRLVTILRYIFGSAHNTLRGHGRSIGNEVHNDLGMDSYETLDTQKYKHIVLTREIVDNYPGGYYGNHQKVGIEDLKLQNPSSLEVSEICCICLERLSFNSAAEKIDQLVEDPACIPATTTQNDQKIVKRSEAALQSRKSKLAIKPRVKKSLNYLVNTIFTKRAWRVVSKHSRWVRKNQ